MKHIHTFESFLNEGYSSSDINKLKDFAKKVSDEIIADYEGDSKFDKEEFSPEAMFDYISDWGQTNNMSAKDVIDEFVWSELTDELGLPRN
jgi:hypothetical protein